MKARPFLISFLVLALAVRLWSAISPAVQHPARADLVLAAPLFRPLSDAPWHANVKVNDDAVGAPQRLPSIAVDPSGNAYAAWEDGRSEDHYDHIYFSYRPAGGEWGPNMRIDDSPVASGVPSIAVDPSGNAYAVWQDYRNWNMDIYFSYRPAGGSWAASVRLDDDPGTESQGSPSIAVDTSGNAYAVWEDDRNGTSGSDIYFSYRPAGGSWGPNVQINEHSGEAGPGAEPCIAVDPSGNAYAVWADHRALEYHIYFSYRPAGGEWGPNMRIDDSPVGSGLPFIAVDPGGTAYVVWTDHRNGDSDIYFSYRPAGGSWAASVRVDDDPGTAAQCSQSIAVDPSGNAYAVWEDHRHGNYDVYFSYRPAGGPWHPNIRVNDDGGMLLDQREASIAVDPSGNAYAVWHDYRNGNYDIYFSYRPAAEAPPPTVKVEDENENALSGARVYRNGTIVGITGLGGTLVIPDLQVGDQLAATYRILEQPSPKGHHSQDSTQNWAYRVYVTSADIDDDGTPHLHEVLSLDTLQTLIVKKTNTLIGFNIVASVEWDAKASYLEELRLGFERAGAYLYDASDGQMLLERVTVYDNAQYWADADYQIRASNQEWPRANVDGLLSGEHLYVFLGRYFDGNSANRGDWTAPNGYRTQIHEFGHYGLGLYDHYFYYQDDTRRDGACTSTTVRTNDTPDINATVMYYQYNATEFSMQGVEGLWSDQCEYTRQWQAHEESDWETIVRHYMDAAGPARWHVVTPGIRGAVVEGPSNIPVAAWHVASIGNDSNTGTCSSNPVFEVTHLWGAPASCASVWLRRSDRSKIYQGKTDAQGLITILGAGNGDKVIVRAWGVDLWINSVTVSCVEGLAAGETGPVVAQLVLQLAPFTLDVELLPTGGVNQAEMRVRASTTLDGLPDVEVSQTGAAVPITVSMAYEPGTDIYTGTVTLEDALPRTGSIEVNATDIEAHSLQTFSAFNLPSVTPAEDITIYSPDGIVELHLPIGTFSADGRVSIVSDDSADGPSEELVTLSGPYNIQADEGIALTGNAELTLRYLNTGGSLRHANVSTAQIYHWDASIQQWVPLTSTVGSVHQWVSASIDSLGIYALIADRQYTVTLPLVMKSY